MIHILDDSHGDGTLAKRRMICGIAGALPAGDVFWYPSEANADYADCPGCNPDGPRRRGTPLSQLSGRPGEPGFAEFCRIAESWGYE